MSKETERNESTDIVLKRVLENDFHHTRFNSLAKNVTDNRALDKGKETYTYKTFLTYAERVEKPTEQVVDFYALTQRIHQRNLVVIKENEASLYSARKMRYFPF